MVRLLQNEHEMEVEDFGGLLLSPFLHHPVQCLDALAVGAAETADG